MLYNIRVKEYRMANASLFVNPRGSVCGPLIDSLTEPKSDLSLGTLH